jgi:hypothetical protein
LTWGQRFFFFFNFNLSNICCLKQIRFTIYLKFISYEMVCIVLRFCVLCLMSCFVFESGIVIISDCLSSVGFRRIVTNK